MGGGMGGVDKLSKMAVIIKVTGKTIKHVVKAYLS